MISYGQSAGYAEQALQAVKVVHTYGQEKLELKNYTKYLDRALATSHVQITKAALGTGALYLSFLSLYAYAFYFAGVLRWNEVESAEGKLYSGGTIITCMFCIVFGSMQAGGCGPHIRAVAEGRAAGRIAFSAIDQVPAIKVDEPGTTKVNKETSRGEIQFQDVCFSYPSRPDVKVLKNFTCTFE
jgi:ABC-type multidrug transport system fused ATPase/permease subunit